MKRIFFNAGIRNQSLGRAYRYDEELVVPIIENTPFEEDLKDRMAEIIQSYCSLYADIEFMSGVIHGSKQKQC